MHFSYVQTFERFYLSSLFAWGTHFFFSLCLAYPGSLGLLQPSKHYIKPFTSHDFRQCVIFLAQHSVQLLKHLLPPWVKSSPTMLLQHTRQSLNVFFSGMVIKGQTGSVSSPILFYLHPSGPWWQFRPACFYLLSHFPIFIWRHIKQNHHQCYSRNNLHWAHKGSRMEALNCSWLKSESSYRNVLLWSGCTQNVPKIKTLMNFSMRRKHKFLHFCNVLMYLISSKWGGIEDNW